jgi:hypothetical protein
MGSFSYSTARGLSDEVTPIADIGRVCRFSRQVGPVLLVLVFIFFALYMVFPAVGVAQGPTSVGGLEEGERDTTRMDRRVKGKEEQVIDARISDQKIGYEERRIRLERRAEELLRSEEVARERQEEWTKSEEEKRAEARKREQEDIQRKKRAVDVSPDL